ncbi:MAG: hypothetical protein HS115_05920 [Spirochaetales bacterium]|nr:hypothetical protein [Spirochaetales bacterium]
MLSMGVNAAQRIEEEFQTLSVEERWKLVEHLAANLWTAWDSQVEDDSNSGKLDYLVAEVQSEIQSGQTVSLNEVLHNS